MVLSKEKGALHKEKWPTGDWCHIKAASEEIWDYKMQPGNQMLFHIILVVPLGADDEFI